MVTIPQLHCINSVGRMPISGILCHPGMVHGCDVWYSESYNYIVHLSWIVRCLASLIPRPSSGHGTIPGWMHDCDVWYS